MFNHQSEHCKQLHKEHGARERALYHKQAVGNVRQVISVLQASGPSPIKWDNDALQDVVRVTNNVGKGLA